MNWTLIVEREAQRNLERFPKRDRERIAAAPVAMQQDPFSGDVVHLRGSASGYRRRVGAYRILFTLGMREQRIHVTNITRRTSTTY
jgi:mRNA-degrading endonuclease RelE of RelBE toxin-antitoxin system